jgi:hypothetical protein
MPVGSAHGKLGERTTIARRRTGVATLTPIGYSPLAAIYVHWLSANTLVAGILSAAARSALVVYRRLTASGNAYQSRILRS